MDGEGGASSGLALRRDAAAVTPDDAARDRQPHGGADARVVFAEADVEGSTRPPGDGVDVGGGPCTTETCVVDWEGVDPAVSDADTSGGGCEVSTSTSALSTLIRSPWYWIRSASFENRYRLPLLKNAP